MASITTAKTMTRNIINKVEEMNGKGVVTDGMLMGGRGDDDDGATGATGGGGRGGGLSL